ncbi:MAG: TetR-like C-terminal domain-containing protein [Oscillospiraceae bacterium]
MDYAQKNRRAIMHVYNSVSRDTFEASVMKLCAYMTEQYLKVCPFTTPTCAFPRRTARCCSGSSSASSSA